MTDILKKLSKYLNEEGAELRIYFAHPQLYYNTKWETKAIMMIKKKFPQHIIINPSGSSWSRRAQKLGFQPFYQAVKLADLTVALPLEIGSFSGGTHKEMVKAESLGKDVWVVNPWKNTLKQLKNVKSVKFLKKDDPYYDQFSWDED